MKITIGIHALATVFLLGLPSVGQSAGTQAAHQIRERVQEQPQQGPLAEKLRQLRLGYRSQVGVLLEERRHLIEQYMRAAEEDRAEIRLRIRRHQAIIAETHRRLRRELRDQIREVRRDRRRQIDAPGG